MHQHCQQKYLAIRRLWTLSQKHQILTEQALESEPVEEVAEREKHPVIKLDGAGIYVAAAIAEELE